MQKELSETKVSENDLPIKRYGLQSPRTTSPNSNPLHGVFRNKRLVQIFTSMFPI